MANLVVTTGPLAGQRMSVDSEIVLGRREGDLVIDDLEVSRRHAVIRARDGVIEIDDLDSTNGTFVNGSRIAEPRTVLPGDVIQVGQTRLELEEEWRSADTMVTPILSPKEQEVSAPVLVSDFDREAASPPEPDLEQQHVTERLPTTGVAPEAPGRSRRAWAIAAADDVCQEAQGQLDGVDLGQTRAGRSSVGISTSFSAFAGRSCPISGLWTVPRGCAGSFGSSWRSRRPTSRSGR
jgi:predicted component of type VI protein secretion system